MLNFIKTLGLGRVILENPITREEQNKSGLYLPATRDEGHIRKSKVLKTSPDCKEVTEGDTVFFNVALRETFGEDELSDEYIVVKESDILMKAL